MRLLLLILLAGCSDLVKVSEPHTVTITWDRAAPTNCGRQAQPSGCAYRSHNYMDCRVVMPEDAADFVVAEEFRHCFGYEHRL